MTSYRSIEEARDYYRERSHAELSHTSRDRLAELSMALTDRTGHQVAMSTLMGMVSDIAADMRGETNEPGAKPPGGYSDRARARAMHPAGRDFRK